MTYRDREEIQGLVRFYIDHPAERQRIAAAGRERVLGCHTYEHRIETMIRMMKERYS